MSFSLTCTLILNFLEYKGQNRYRYEGINGQFEGMKWPWPFLSQVLSIGHGQQWPRKLEMAYKIERVNENVIYSSFTKILYCPTWALNLSFILINLSIGVWTNINQYS